MYAILGHILVFFMLFKSRQMTRETCFEIFLSQNINKIWRKRSYGLSDWGSHFSIFRGFRIFYYFNVKSHQILNVKEGQTSRESGIT